MCIKFKLARKFFSFNGDGKIFSWFIDYHKNTQKANGNKGLK
jgi:hypothetical protein